MLSCPTRLLTGPARLGKACEDIEQARKQLCGNVNLRLTAEILAVKLINATR